MNPLILAYNKDHFRQAGLDPEKPPETWDEWVETIRLLTLRDKQGRILRSGFTPHRFDILQFHILQQGAWVITEDGRSVYYYCKVALKDGILMQPLSANGAPSGAPVTALSIPGEDVLFAMLDSARTWMSYYRVLDSNMYVTRVSSTGQATGTPVKVTSAGPSQWAAGGITRNPRLLIYTLVDTAANTFTVFSQKLDANGNPAGAPTLLVAASPYMAFAWIVVG